MQPENQNEPITVVKIGGNADVDANAVCEDVALMVEEGKQVVVVHGGSAEIERLADQLGVPQTEQVAPDGVTARHTDAETLDVVTMALAGSVKPRLILALARRGIGAIGMTGLDGGLLGARRKRPQRAVVGGRTVMVRDNLAGTVEEVDTTMVQAALAQNLVPVISPPAITTDGEALNVNADRAAAAVAVALDAEDLVLLTGAAGVQEDPKDEETLFSEVHVASEGPPPTFAKGGMAMKLIAAREALVGGVRRVIVSDGRGGKPVREALDGSGTRVRLGRRRRGRQS
jgi:acetylglutamate/LysW-gamma-L-alpha-aminoadipate kinase